MKGRHYQRTDRCPSSGGRKQQRNAVTGAIPNAAYVGLFRSRVGEEKENRTRENTKAEDEKNTLRKPEHTKKKGSQQPIQKSGPPAYRTLPEVGVEVGRIPQEGPHQEKTY